jgi:histidine ammonia-lyase
MKLAVRNQLVTLGELRRAWLEPVEVSLGDDARRRIAESRELIEEVVAHGDQVYGVNTGFGQLASVRVGDSELAHLQENLVRSHAVGVGEDLDDNIVRLVMLMKVIALAEGFSGVRLELVEKLCDLINNNIYPRIPSRGSVGASGDLAPLAHMAGAGSRYRANSIRAKRGARAAQWYAGLDGARVECRISHRECPVSRPDGGGYVL